VTNGVGWACLFKTGVTTVVAEKGGGDERKWFLQCKRWRTKRQVRLRQLERAVGKNSM